MQNVIVRNLADDDVAVLKRAAAASHMSLQAYLANELSNEAARLRRQDAIATMRNRMAGRSTVDSADVRAGMAEMRKERTGEEGA